MSRSWVDRAERAITGAPAGPEDEVFRGEKPPLFDALARRAAVSPLLAALVWCAVYFRELVTDTPLDPLALGLRLLAWGLTARTLVLGARMLARLKIHSASAGYALVLTPSGLFYRSPEGGDVVIERDHVVGVAEHGRWQERPAGRRWGEVYVATAPEAARPYIVIPPVFCGTPGRLAEQLMKWAKVREVDPDRSFPPPHALASKVYDEAAEGTLPEGSTLIAHGRGWMKKGPYATLLLTLAALDGFVRAGPEVLAQIGLPMLLGIGAVILSVPAVWIWLTRREIAPRKGIALLLTPSELLMRTRQGTLRAHYKELSRVSVDVKKRWTVLDGATEERELVITRKGKPPIRYHEAFLGSPVEAARLLIDAYRKGWLPIQDELAPEEDSAEAAVNEAPSEEEE